MDVYELAIIITCGGVVAVGLAVIVISLFYYWREQRQESLQSSIVASTAMAMANRRVNGASAPHITESTLPNIEMKQRLQTDNNIMSNQR